MKALLASVLLAVLSVGIASAEDKTDIEYGTAGGKSLWLDAHVPDGPGPFPMVLIVHGGGWNSGDKRKGMDAFLDPLSKSAEFTWFSINYRLAPTNHWPACFEDVQTAIRWVKAHGSEYKGNPRRLALLGYSAGGQLVCLAAVRANEDTRVQAVVGFAPPTDMVADTERRGGLSQSLQSLFGRTTVDDPARALLKEMSAIDFVKPGLPPFLLIQGDADKSVLYDQTLRFQAKLKENGVACELITIKGAPHRIADWARFDTTYRQRMIEWLEKMLGRAVVSPLAAQTVAPDMTVAGDGSGDFTTIQQAVNSIPHDNRQRMIIYIKDGLYHEKVRIDRDFITLRGQSRAGTRIEFAQGADEFASKPDGLGRAVVNVNRSDCVLERLTVKNTHGVIGPHAFAIYGQDDRTVIVDCNVLSDGADTLALGKEQRDRSYLARLNIRGSVDFVCPRGWCYMTDCTLSQVNPKADATIWHDGSKDKDMKFVMRRCSIGAVDGVTSWVLARHHHDAQFFLLDCAFSKTMSNLPPKRVVYPLGGGVPSEADIERNRGLDASNIWGERAYFYNCHRDGGDYGWQQDNLSSAPNSPTPDQVTAAWTFAGTWDPDRRSGPTIRRIVQQDDTIKVVFSENVTARGKPRLVLKSGGFADYTTGSGSDTLLFAVPSATQSEVVGFDLQGSLIIASEAGAASRFADLSLP